MRCFDLGVFVTHKTGEGISVVACRWHVTCEVVQGVTLMVLQLCMCSSVRVCSEEEESGRSTPEGKRKSTL